MRETSRPQISWTSNPAGSTRTATVSATGLVTGVYPGNANVTVSIDGIRRRSGLS